MTVDDCNFGSEPGIHIYAGFRGLRLEDELASLIRDFRIGGIVLFRRNIESEDQVRRLIGDAQEYALKELGRPLLCAIDQEGGTVQRLSPPFERLPSAKEIAPGGPALVSKWARKAAADMRSLGMHINFAPVLDVVSDPGHFMGSRSLGDNADQVSRLGRAWIEALQESGISATAKHFPGLGRSGLDPHTHAPVIGWRNEAESEEDLRPFYDAVSAGVHCIMTSHAIYPEADPIYPATLSRALCRDLLRARMNFSGVLFADDLDMAAVCGKFSFEETAVRGVQAGIDAFLICQHPENVGPFYGALSDALEKDEELKRLQRESIGRLRGLYRFHFGK